MVNSRLVRSRNDNVQGANSANLPHMPALSSGIARCVWHSNATKRHAFGTATPRNATQPHAASRSLVEARRSPRRHAAPSQSRHTKVATSESQRHARQPHAAYLKRDQHLGATQHNGPVNATLHCNASPRNSAAVARYAATHATVAGNAANAATQRPSFTQLETTPPDLCAAARIATKRDKFHESARSNDAPTSTHVLKCPLPVLRLV